jgi:SAM-dependent methyltransferase
MHTSVQADYATCFFNTVGFFNDAEQVKAFRSLYRSLKPQGKFIIDCMNLFFLAPLIKPVYDTKRNDGYLFRQNSMFDSNTNTRDSTFEIVNPDGRVEESKEFHQRLFAPGDLAGVIETAGFKVQSVYGNYKRDPATSETPQVIVVASK